MLPDSVAPELARFFTRGVPGEQPPAMDELVREVMSPSGNSRVGAYLAPRGDLQRAIERIVEGVIEESQREIELAAYYRFKERERRGDHPLHGRDTEDWLVAERELARHEVRNIRNVA